MKYSWQKYRRNEPDPVEGSGIFSGKSLANQKIPSRRVSPGTDRPITPDEAPEIAEIDPTGRATVLHQPKTFESYENRKHCQHEEDFKVDNIDPRSGLVDEVCPLCGHGRIRGMTPDERAQINQD